MYIDYSAWEEYDYKITSLQLDASNPRIRYKGDNLNQSQIIKILLDEEKIYELAKKISEEGYFVGEEPIVCIENNKKIVLEGNRRVAALKLLLNPKKYLSRIRADILSKNILKNNIKIEDRKIRCYIAPNRLLANPIIYERHKGEAVKKWKTGNQYSFVSEMYQTDGLSIEDICEVLNEKRGNIVKLLKVCNLFFEGQEILEKEEGISIDIASFDLTNLERFYLFEDARKFLGIDFDNNNGDLIIKLPREEFTKRVIIVFKILIDSERFSREFNNDEDKKIFIGKLNKNPNVDLSVKQNEEGDIKSRASEKRADLDAEKNKSTRRRKPSKNKFYKNYIIPRDIDIFFNHEKLDSLFSELKSLPVDKKYSFAMILRSYLEQALEFYLKEKNLFEEVSAKAKETIEANNNKKIETLSKYLRSKHKVEEELDETDIKRILKLELPKDFSTSSLKTMLDYIVKYKIQTYLDSEKYKSVKDYAERIKMGLDLTVHNINTVVDVDYNRRAWNHLEPILNYLNETLNDD